MFCLLFDEDTTLLFTDKDHEIAVDNINLTLNSVTVWFQASERSVNLDKTNFMFYHMRNDKRVNSYNIKIKILDCNIKWSGLGMCLMEGPGMYL